MSDSADEFPAAAREVIDRFELEPHPEGGWYRQSFRDKASDGTVRSTAIYFLLAAGERSHWHRVLHTAEVWHHYDGDPIRLRLSADGVTTEQHVLGTDLAAGERPQVIGHFGSERGLGSGRGSVSRPRGVQCSYAESS